MRLIDADELKTELTLHYAHLNDKAAHTSIELDRIMYINTATGVIHAINKLNNAPTVEIPVARWDCYCEGQKVGYEKALSERPQGEWLVEKNQFGDILHCSICGARPRRSEYGYDLHDKFCNECGADMRKAVRND